MNKFNDTFTPAGTQLTLNRMGYGSMQLPGPHVWGPPKDKNLALKVIREAISLGINHIDTAQFYGPNISNRLIREALPTYPKNLCIATKVGFIRGSDGSWNVDLSPHGLKQAIYENCETLGLDCLDIVNLRLGNAEGPAYRPFMESLEVLVDMQKEGVIRHIGLSNVTSEQFVEARKIVEIICVQNQYNLINRQDDTLIDYLAEQGVAYVPFFPLGGFTPLNSSLLTQVANELVVTPKQVALAWLLQRSPNILVISGTSSLEHLHENFNASKLKLTEKQIKTLDKMKNNS